MVCQMLGDKVLVRCIGEDGTTASGIIIPQTVSSDKLRQGVVVAVGPGRPKDDGSLIVPSVKVDDMVMYVKSSVIDVKIEGVDHVVMREESILYVLK